MAYSKAKLKSSGDEASPCFSPIGIGKLLDKCVPIRTILYVSFKDILISLNSFMGTPNSMRILYNTSLPTESEVFLKSRNSLYSVPLYLHLTNTKFSLKEFFLNKLWPKS
jgi:hypothetical protein